MRQRHYIPKLLRIQQETSDKILSIYLLSFRDFGKLENRIWLIIRYNILWFTIAKKRPQHVNTTQTIQYLFYGLTLSISDNLEAFRTQIV